MRENAKLADALTLQSERTEKLLCLVESTSTTRSRHNGAITARDLATGDAEQQDSISKGEVVTADTHRKRRYTGKAYRFHVSLPRYFTNCIWEFCAYKSDGIWTTQVYPVNIRPTDTIGFECVRLGDIHAVRELIRSGELSFRDHDGYGPGSSLLEVGVEDDGS